MKLSPRQPHPLDEIVHSAELKPGIGRLLLVFLILILLGSLIPGCATDTGNPAKDRRGRVTNAVLADIAKAVGAAAFSELSKGFADTDHADSAAAGLWTEGLYQAGTSLVNSNTLRDLINAYSGHDLSATAAVAATAFRDAAPFTITDQKAIVATIAQAISTAARSEASP